VRVDDRGDVQPPGLTAVRWLSLCAAAARSGARPGLAARRLAGL